MIKLPVYEVFIEDTDFIGLALVDSPAINRDFIYFSDETVKMIFDDEKMMVKGPALIPNKLIYRSDKLGERYVYFSEETVIKFVETLMEKKENKFNLDHSDNYLNATMIESYFAIEPNEFGVPKNSWIVSLKIKDPEVWKQIKEGEFNGFSVQGLFTNKLINNFNKQNDESMKDLKNKLIDAMNSVLFPSETEEPVETPVETPAPEVEVEEPEISAEELIAKVQEMLNQFKQEILAAVDEKIAAVGAKVEEVSEKVEEFGKQPIQTEQKKEKVENPRPVSNPAARFFQ